MLEGIAIVGIGLIGGSVGLSARSKNLAKRIYGIGRSPEKLAHAVQFGAIDEFSVDFAPVAKCDLVVVCTPVGQVAIDVMKAAQKAKPGTLLVDAGSTKSKIVAQIETEISPQTAFVGCHPIAGSERSGAAAARADLFENRLTVITPTPRTPPEALKAAADFWRSLGSRIIETAPDLHDAIFATTSHLPHLLATAMAMSTPQDYLKFTGGGWRDQTRIAAGEPANWAQIFLANRERLLEALAGAERNIAALKAAIEASDRPSLEALLKKGKEHRDALGS